MITKGSGIISFQYNESDLWDKVQQHIGMVVKLLPDAEKLYPTADDLDFFKREMYKALVIAYEPIHKLSTGNIGDVNVTTYGGPTPATTYQFFIKDIYGHKETSLTLIDINIETLIIDIFLKAWWLKCGMAEQYKVAVSDVQMHMAVLNNSCYSLFKPSFTPSPVWSSETVTVVVTEDEEGVTTTTETTTGTGGTTTAPATQEVLYFATFAEFPVTGTVDIIYVDRATNTMYDWNGTAYEVYGGVAGEYSINYVNENTKVVVHGLGKMSPTITATDADGNTFEPLWSPIDVNSGTASWNTVGSGILRFN